MRQALRHHAFWKLAFAFAANSFIFSALSVHLIPILSRFGHPISLVVLMAALIGALLALLFYGQRQWAMALFGSANYGAIPGAMAGPAMLSKAAGPLAVAAVIQFDPSPVFLFGLLMAISLSSLLFYLMAIRAPDAHQESPLP